jgi:hypothetical protein
MVTMKLRYSCPNMPGLNIAGHVVNGLVTDDPHVQQAIAGSMYARRIVATPVGGSKAEATSEPKEDPKAHPPADPYPSHVTISGNTATIFKTSDVEAADKPTLNKMAKTLGLTYAGSTEVVRKRILARLAK